MYKLICEMCGADFEHSQGHTKTCSMECRRERINNIYGRYAVTDLPTGTVGAISEMIVAVDLMKKGYAVFRAMSPASQCDLVFVVPDSGWTAITVEVRTGYRSATGNINFAKGKRDKGRQDLFAVYVRAENKVYYFYEDGKTLAKEFNEPETT